VASPPIFVSTGTEKVRDGKSKGRNERRGVLSRRVKEEDVYELLDLLPPA
jgi:hypothetical protein